MNIYIYKLNNKWRLITCTVTGPLSGCHLSGSAEGVISSHMTEETGCGSATSPWVISADKGKTIIIDIVDFGSESFKYNNRTEAFPLYGYIKDGSKQHEIFGSLEREKILYHSKTNEVTIEILATENDPVFLLHFKSKYFLFFWFLSVNLSESLLSLSLSLSLSLFPSVCVYGGEGEVYTHDIV